MASRLRWLLAAVLIAACSTPAAPVPALPVTVHRARLIAVDGDVRVKHATANDYEAATKGVILSIADLVSTGKTGHATISFDDGSTAMLTPHSLISIEPPAVSSAGGIQVQSGRVDIEIASSHAGQFRIRTPDAEAAMPARHIDFVGKK